ncbi:hypothetical protein ABG067_001671 [Albugo candida]
MQHPAQLADVLDAAYVALGMPTVARNGRASQGFGHDAAANRHTYVIAGYILRYEEAGISTGGKEC